MPRPDPERLKLSLAAALKENAETMPGLHWEVSDDSEEVSDDGEKVVLTFTEEWHDGKLEIRYQPGAGIEKRGLRCGEGIAKMLLDGGVSVANTGEFYKIRDSLSSDPIAKEEKWTPIFFHWYMIFYVYCLHNNIALAFRAAGRDAEFVTAAKAGEIQKQAIIQTFDNITDLKLAGLKDHMEMLIKETEQEKRDLLEQYLQSASPAPHLYKIGEHYDKLYPIWKDIKRIYAEHGSAATWREMVRAKYPDVKFDDDLLTRITGDLSSLSEPTLRLVEQSGGESIPSSVAIEHAARLCGTWKYQLTVRSLFKARNKARDSKASDVPELDAPDEDSK